MEKVDLGHNFETAFIHTRILKVRHLNLNFKYMSTFYIKVIKVF